MPSLHQCTHEPCLLTSILCLQGNEAAGLLSAMRGAWKHISIWIHFSSEMALAHAVSISTYCAGDTLLHEAVNMSSRVGLVKPNDHVVVVQMISDSLVVKARLPLMTSCA